MEHNHPLSKRLIKMPCILLKPKVHHPVHKCKPLFPILVNQIHFLKQCFLKNHILSPLHLQLSISFFFKEAAVSSFSLKAWIWKKKVVVWGWRSGQKLFLIYLDVKNFQEMDPFKRFFISHEMHPKCVILNAKIQQNYTWFIGKDKDFACNINRKLMCCNCSPLMQLTANYSYCHRWRSFVLPRQNRSPYPVLCLFSELTDTNKKRQ